MTEIKHSSLSCQNIYAGMGTGRKTAEVEQVTRTVHPLKLTSKAIWKAWKAWTLNSEFHFQKLIRVLAYYLLLATAGATLYAFNRIASTILAGVFG